MKKLDELQLTQAEEKSFYQDCKTFIKTQISTSSPARGGRLDYLRDICFSQKERHGPQFNSASFNDHIQRANLSRDKKTIQMINDIEFLSHPGASYLISQQKSSDDMHSFSEKISKGIGSPGLLNSSSEPSAELPRGSQRPIPHASRSTPSATLPSSQSSMDFKQAASQASKGTPDLISRSSLANSNKTSPTLPNTTAAVSPSASFRSIPKDSGFGNIPPPLSPEGSQKGLSPPKPEKSFKFKKELQEVKQSASEETKKEEDSDSNSPKRH
jgi:hypothetical protein